MTRLFQRMVAPVFALLVVASPAAAQVCMGIPLPTRSFVGAQLGNVDLTEIRESDPPVMRDFGFTFAHRAFQLPDRAIDGVVRVSGAFGWLSDDQVQRTDTDLRRFTGELTLERRSGPVSLCASVGVFHGYRRTDEPVTRTDLTFPFTLSVGAVGDFGDFLLIPYLAPTIAYADTDIELADGSETGWNGRDRSLETGLSLVVGRITVGGAALLRREEYNDEVRLMLRGGVNF